MSTYASSVSLAWSLRSACTLPLSVLWTSLHTSDVSRPFLLPAGNGRRGAHDQGT